MPAARLDDPQFWEDFFTLTAESTRSGQSICAELGANYKSAWYRLDADPALKERYKAALRASASVHAAKVGQVLETLETDDTYRADRARVLIEGHKWMASRKDRETYGDDKQPLVQVNFDTAGLAALRRLAAAPVPRLEDGSVVDAEFTASKDPGGAGSEGAGALDALLE